MFNLKGDRAEVPDIYLGISIHKVETVDVTEYWVMSAEKYVKAAVKNVKLKLAESNCKIPSCCDTFMSTIYYPSEDFTKEMNVD